MHSRCDGNYGAKNFVWNNWNGMILNELGRGECEWLEYNWFIFNFIWWKIKTIHVQRFFSVLFHFCSLFLKWFNKFPDWDCFFRNTALFNWSLKCMCGNFSDWSAKIIHFEQHQFCFIVCHRLCNLSSFASFRKKPETLCAELKWIRYAVHVNAWLFDWLFGCAQQKTPLYFD